MVYYQHSNTHWAMLSTVIKHAEKSHFSVIAKLLNSKMMVSYQIKNIIVNFCVLFNCNISREKDFQFKSAKVLI